MSQHAIAPPGPVEAERRRRHAEDEEDEQREHRAPIQRAGEGASLPLWHPALERLARGRRARRRADRQAP